MSAAWDGRVVTASAHLPPDLVAAVLRGGAKAVVCAAAEDAEPPPDGAAAFFRSLFGLLGNSVTLLQVRALRMKQVCCLSSVPRLYASSSPRQLQTPVHVGSLQPGLS